MSCATSAELLSAYLDDELPAVGRQELAYHLAACPQCAAELEAMQGTKRLLQSLRAETGDPSERIWAAVTARLDAMPHRAPLLQRPIVGWRLLAAAALVVAALGGSYRVYEARYQGAARAFDALAAAHYQQVGRGFFGLLQAAEGGEMQRPEIAGSFEAVVGKARTEQTLLLIGGVPVSRFVMARNTVRASLLQPVAMDGLELRVGTVGDQSLVVYDEDGRQIALVAAVPLSELVHLVHHRDLLPSQTSY